MAATIKHSPLVHPAQFTNLLGFENVDDRMGVIGSNPAEQTFGFLAGNDPVFSQHAGVYGQSDQQGVMGLATSDSGTGVYGGNANPSGAHGIGVRGETHEGVGVQGRSFGKGLAGRFIGKVQVTDVLDAHELQVDGIAIEPRIAILEQGIAALQEQNNTLTSQVAMLIDSMVDLSRLNWICHKTLEMQLTETESKH